MVVRIGANRWTVAALISSFWRPSFDKLAIKIRQRNYIYLALSLIARVLNALGMFLAIQRFSPTTFGEMSYLQATAVSTVAFSTLGIELSLNARLTRKLQEGSPIGPTIMAACALAFGGMIVACIVVSTVFASQLKISNSADLAVLAVCIYSSFMICTSLLTALSFALNSSVLVGLSYLVTSGIFLVFAIFANANVSGVGLMFFSIIAQLVAVSFMAISLLKSASKRGRKRSITYFEHPIHETRIEIKTLFLYGAKQILVVSAVTFSQWFIQRKIVFGDGGASENAIYSVGNQIFNMMTFIPSILTPIIVTKLAAAGTDVALRRKICLDSLRLFVGLAVCACVATFVGLRLGIPFLPPRYAAAAETGLIASLAAAVQIMRTPFSLFFLSELKASREIASAAAGALFMIVATSMFTQLRPNEGTMIRLLGCALQAGLVTALFLIETRRSRQPIQP
jgi:O-antigen/teichoic acid export membrane protein